MVEALTRLLLASDLLELAGPASYARGVAYADDARVTVRDADGQKAEALVRGTEAYRVELAATRGRLAWSCSCPVGAGGDFCKHAVATAVVLGRGRGGEPGAPAEPAGGELEEYLASLPPHELTALILEQAAHDPRLHDRLSARAAAKSGTDVDQAAWRKRVDAAFRRRGRFVSYGDAPEWARGVYDLLDALREILDAGHAEVVVSLAERCHKKSEAAMNYLDDSDGWLTDIFHRVGDLHHRACVVSRPEPVPFARRLAKLELGAELDTFHRAAARYADVLGEPGLAEYRRVVEPRWAALGDADDSWSQDSFRIREAMVGIALASGDPDELIRVKQGDLRITDDYEEIAAFLRATGRDEEAIEWAQIGLSRFADRPWQLRSLQELLAELLRERGKGGEAVDLFAGVFATRPSVDGYTRLLREAERVGEEAARRQWALGLVRADPRHVAALVAILLHEGELDEAWLVAGVHGCDQRLWLALARARGETHPLEVIPVFVTEMNAQISTKSKAGYRKAAQTLAHIQELAEAGDAPERFDAILERVRDEHKQKRTLMAVIDQNGW